MNFYEDPTFRRISQKFKHNANLNEPPNNLTIESFDIIEAIGRGGFGTVYKAKPKLQQFRRYGNQQQYQPTTTTTTTNKPEDFLRYAQKHNIRTVALKVISKSKVTNESLRHRLAAEVAIHRVMDHPGIVRMYDFFEDEENVYLIMEYCSGGDLWKYLKSRSQNPKYSSLLSEEEIRGLMLQISRAVVYMHQNGILHRDLKLTNLLVTGDMEIRLTDFGLATQIEDTGSLGLNEGGGSSSGDPMTVCGTVNYMSPEIVTNETYGFESDIWALGCLFITFLTGKSPFDKFKQQKRFGERKQDIQSYYDALAQIRLPANVSDEAKGLATHMLQMKPHKRIKTTDLLSHPFFSPVLPTKGLKLLVSTNRAILNQGGGGSDGSDEAEPWELQREKPGMDSNKNQFANLAKPNFERPPIHPMDGRLVQGRNNLVGNNLHRHQRRLISSREDQIGGHDRLHRGGGSSSSRTGPHNEITMDARYPDTMISSVPVESTAIVGKKGSSSQGHSNSYKTKSSGEDSEHELAKNFSTKHLAPRKHKQENRTLEIMADGRVLLEITGEKHLIVVDPTSATYNPKVLIFPHGTAIFEARKATRNFDLSEILDRVSRSGGKIPSSLTSKVKYMMLCVEKIRSKTRKIILQTPQGQATLMENLPLADFQFSFLNGIKVLYIRRKQMAEIRIPSKQDLPDEIHRVSLQSGQSNKRSDRMNKILSHVEESLEKCVAASEITNQWEDLVCDAPSQKQTSNGSKKGSDYTGKIKFPVHIKWEQDLNGYVPPGLVKVNKSVESRILEGQSKYSMADGSSNIASSGKTRVPTSIDPYQFEGIQNDPNGDDDEFEDPDDALEAQYGGVPLDYNNTRPVNSRNRYNNPAIVEDTNSQLWNKPSSRARHHNHSQDESSRKAHQTPMSYSNEARFLFTTPINRVPMSGYSNNNNTQLTRNGKKPSNSGLMPAIIAGKSDRFQFIPSVGWCIYRPITDSNHTRYLVTPQRNRLPNDLYSDEDHEFILLFNDGIMMVVDSSRKYIGWWDQKGDSEVPDQQFHVDDPNLPVLVYRKFEKLQLFADSMGV
ncbi:hypothetical protein H4219_004529 [Mycoemilia scoparia]|uniref:Non-specific serine/threonine protein kinase n=1 Tax=Mycoemilia scoparia TaxID=417184 RepID=A0A9W8DRR0_9FUNG|nr:hypothetical protein H4219_004529 [Mycoemilia scoparia]